MQRNENQTQRRGGVRRMQLTVLLVAAALLAVWLAACSGGQAAAPEAATPAAQAAADTPAATTEPPAPTATAVSPTAEATAVPDEPTPAPTEEAPTPNAEATPLPDGWLGPPFPPNVNPLTGETVEDPSVLDRRPIAIKISNYPPVVRPQGGLNRADLVFEHYAEGGATRWTAIFYSQDSYEVGSVRSARIIDFEIPVMYDAAFGFSGAAGPNKERFGQVDWFERIISPDFGHSGFYRIPPEDPEVDFWHTMFTDTYRLREILEERGEEHAPNLQNGMLFSETPPEDGMPAKQVEVGYSASYVTWWYDSGNGRYYRWTDGERHDDARTGEQINFKNVVVIAAMHVDTWIPETEVGQGAKSIEIQLWGEGPASIFRDGQRYEGRWIRTNPQDMLTFTDLEGNPLPLGIGNTWFEVVPIGFSRLFVTEQ